MKKIIFALIGIILLVSSFTLFIQNQNLKKEINALNARIVDLEKRMEETKKSSPTVVQPATSLTPTPNIDISDWKTYQNEQYGYEIKYPNNWNEEEAEKSAIHFRSIDINCDIYVEEKNNQTIEQWVQKENNRYIKIKDITVDGSSGLLAKDAYTEGGDYSVAIFPHKNNTYIMLAGCDSSSTKKLEKPLSTFKFIEK